MVTIDHPGPQLDEITLTVRGQRPIVLNKYSDSRLLDRALAELKRSLSRKADLSEQDCGLMKQAVDELLYYQGINV